VGGRGNILGSEWALVNFASARCDHASVSLSRSLGRDLEKDKVEKGGRIN
jgi:hypothetical protein